MAPSKQVRVAVDGRELTLSNLDKVLYPEAGFTKGQVIDYYTRIAPVLVPHLRNRPLTLKRYPDGVEGEAFYEKNCPGHRPDWMETAKVWSRHNGRFQYYCLVQDLPSLVWVANLASLELHTSLSYAERLEEPRQMVFDLDPGPPADVVQCCQVALWIREILNEHGLEAFPKTSGSKGLQLYVPLNEDVDYEVTKRASLGIAQRLAHEHPREVVHLMERRLRGGKVFIDWSQNDQHKTTVNVYSLRARPRPTVSTPVSWTEVEQAWNKKDAGLLIFEADSVVRRIDKLGDLFEPVLQARQRLPEELLRELPETEPGR